MKIGILSDTHITAVSAGRKLAEHLLNGPFAGVEAILHAGDMVIAELESCFYPLPWYAVRGNMDSAQPGVPEKRLISFAGKRIGLIHGWGAPAGIEQRVMTVFEQEALDVLIFGHSHQPVCKWVGSLLLLNPGSPTDRRYAPCHSVGVLTLGEQIQGEIITLEA
jgi:putative phosphoesterase